MKHLALLALWALWGLLPLSTQAQNAQSSAPDELERFLSLRGLSGPQSTSGATAAPVQNLPQNRSPGTPLDTPPDASLDTPASPSNAKPPPTAASDQPSARMSDLVLTALSALGVPYRRGGDNYSTGFDCSGFVRAIYEQALGLVLPRQAAQQAAATQRIERSELQAGDLVFFNTLRRAYSHVGIYLGDHNFIHSPRPGAAVRIEDMRVNYWSRRFDGARRVVAPPGAASGPAAPSPDSATPAPASLTNR